MENLALSSTVVSMQNPNSNDEAFPSNSCLLSPSDVHPIDRSSFTDSDCASLSPFLNKTKYREKRILLFKALDGIFLNILMLPVYRLKAKPIATLRMDAADWFFDRLRDTTVVFPMHLPYFFSELSYNDIQSIH